MSDMENYDLMSAKKLVLGLTTQTREERPYLSPFYECRPKHMMLNIMSASMDMFHKNRMEVVFDAETLTSLHLYDGPALGKALDSWLRSPVLKALVKNNVGCSPLRFRFTIIHHEVGDEITRENLVNTNTYEALVRDKSAFSVCSFVDMTTSVSVSSYVVKEEIKLRSLVASYALYTESLAILNERMDRFIESVNLGEECMGVEFLAKRKKVINEWLHARYFNDGQLIQFEDQEAYSETAYTMRQLLTSTGDMTRLLDLMISTTLLSNEPMSAKKTKLIIACQVYKCNAPYFVGLCRHYPLLVRNLPDYTETVKKSPSGPIDIVVVKDDNATLLSMSILNPPDFIKMVAKRDAKKLFLCESKELLDDTCLIANRDKPTLDEQCRDILLPFINDQVRRFFGPEYGELDICQEVVNHCLKRTDQLATREKGLDGSSRAIKGCIMYLMTKAKEVLEERHAPEENLYEGSLALKKSRISMEMLDEKNQKDWSFAMKELMQDNENRKELLHHQRQKIDITTLNIMMGKETIFSVILPCVNSSYNAYVANNNNNNNNIVVNNFDNRECKKKLRDYHTAMMEIFKEDDTEIQKTMIANLVENDAMSEIRKRKREPRDSPESKKRLKTDKETKLIQLDDNTDRRPIITITTESVPKQKPVGSRECAFCEIVKPLTSFYNASKYSAHIRNVCHACITRKKKADKDTQ